MKNDFDFIKDKFDNDNLDVPNDLNAEIDNAIANKKAKRIPFSKGKLAGTVAGLVACVAVVAVAVTNMPFAPVQNSKEKPKDSFVSAQIIAEGAELTTFDSYSSVESALKNMGVGKNNHSYGYDFTMKGEIADESLSMNSSTSPNHAQTYLQDKNVDEADTIKTDGKYIYVASSFSNIVNIFVAKGKDAKHVASVDVGSMEIYDFFIHNNKLIVNAVKYQEKKDITNVIIYDISDINSIKKLKSFGQSGYYVSSRMIGDDLYIVSNQYIRTCKDIPYVVYNDKEEKVGCESIVSVVSPSEPNFMIVSYVDTENLKSDTQTRAIIGASENIYCNESNMYIETPVFSMISNLPYDGEESAFDGQSFDSETEIVKVSLNKGITFTATAKIDGTVYSQYAMNEQNGNLRVATTSYDKDGEQINNVFVLDENLKKIGEITGFGKTESIKAVQYVGDYAYVITYEITDPLFVIDLSNPKSPKILGECKIDGFSKMLVPVGDDKLLGIGVYTQEEDYIEDMEVEEGIKLVLFDISDKTNPTVLDEQIFKGYSSNAQYNPKALLVDNENGEYIIPYECWMFSYWAEDRDFDESKTGIISFKINGDKIEIINESKIKLDDDYEYCERCTFVDDHIYMFFHGDYLGSVKR